MDEDDIMAGTVEAPAQQPEAPPRDPTPPTEPAPTIEPSEPPPTDLPPQQTEAEKREERRKKGLGADEKKRGRRLFGGLLGTLDAFKKEERKRDASDAAKRRELITNRIQTKLRSETTISADLSAKERAIRLVRTNAEKKEAEVKSKGSSLATRHRSLLRLSTFLFTHSTPDPSTSDSSLPPSSTYLVSLFPASGQNGPQKPRAEVPLPSLFYLPARLTTEQQEKLDKQVQEVEGLVKQEKKDWVEERSTLEDSIADARKEETTLVEAIDSLRRQKEEVSVPSGLPSNASPERAPGSPEKTPAPAAAPEVRDDDEMKGADGTDGMEVEGEEAVEY